MNKRVTGTVGVLLLLWATALWAEMVYLKDGQVVSGKILSEDRMFISVKNKYQTIRIKRSDIKRIMYGDRKLETVYIELSDGKLIKGYMADQDAVKVFYKKEKISKETVILKKDILRMSSQPFVPLDVGLMLRSGVFYPLNSGSSKLGPAAVFLASAGLNLPLKNFRLFVETGYCHSESSIHPDQYMDFIPVTVNLTCDFSFGLFHLLPKAGLGCAIIKFNDGEGADALGASFTALLGGGITLEILRRRLYAGLWCDYTFFVDAADTWHAVMLTGSVSYRF